ncbi:MAG: GGDEF domain-containing protein [Gammaproteobacteria bacterium]
MMTSRDDYDDYNCDYDHKHGVDSCRFWSNVPPMPTNQAPRWHSELSWVSLVVALQIGFVASGVSLGLLVVDWRWVLALGFTQATLQGVFLLLYASGWLRVFPLNLVFLVHQVLTGVTVIVTAWLAQPYSFELMLFYIPLIIIGYNVSGVTSKVVIALLGCLGFLTVLAIQHVPLWDSRNILHQAILPFWRWLSFFMLSVLAFITSVLSAYLYRLVENKNKQLLAALRTNQQLTVIDNMTGLHNQRYMIEQIEKQKNIADRGEYCFVLAAVAIDHFQTLVDTHSEAAADDVVISVGKILDSHIRNVDVGSRWDNDAVFLILLINTSVDRAKSVFQRISQAVQDRNFLSVGVDDTVTVSIGATQYLCIETWESIAQRALHALKTAQDRGANQIETVLPTTRCVELVRDRDDRLKPLL